MLAATGWRSDNAVRLHFAGYGGHPDPAMRIHAVGLSGNKAPEGMPMRVHAAGRALINTKPYMLPETVLVEEQHPYTLASYAYRQDLEHWRPIWENIEGSVAIIDSGAFTAHTQGKPIEVTDYIDFIGSYREEASPSLSELYFIALDVIGDQKATWTNFNALEKAGETTLPLSLIHI